MKQIRIGFETNSSSSHSLAIGSGTNLLDCCYLGTINEAGEFCITGESEFGWQWEIYDDPPSKLNYLIADSITDPEGMKARLVKIIKERVPNITNVRFLDFEKEGNFGPYVDHQSRGTSEEVKELSDDEVWNWILDEDSAIYCGNDNEEGPY